MTMGQAEAHGVDGVRVPKFSFYKASEHFSCHEMALECYNESMSLSSLSRHRSHHWIPSRYVDSFFS
ncbi:hypothetical protein QTP70_013247 [Hemibagrus guttatus]|uniref:Uncharacterized protein n=1 Tax=Hemibagrus guttatus TaxID=175788 RepID=A0AAE0QTA5_9TELE|nr:hypothetical protein QTP70_013247 [Hemibagrus guttatus]